MSASAKEANSTIFVFGMAQPEFDLNPRPPILEVDALLLSYAASGHLFNV